MGRQSVAEFKLEAAALKLRIIAKLRPSLADSSESFDHHGTNDRSLT